MSRVRPDTGEPGPECYCGSEIKAVPLPAELQALSGKDKIWVHLHNSDTRCYPEARERADRACTAEPVEG